MCCIFHCLIAFVTKFWRIYSITWAIFLMVSIQPLKIPCRYFAVWVFPSYLPVLLLCSRGPVPITVLLIKDFFLRPAFFKSRCPEFADLYAVSLPVQKAGKCTLSPTPLRQQHGRAHLPLQPWSWKKEPEGARHNSHNMRKHELVWFFWQLPIKGVKNEGMAHGFVPVQSQKVWFFLSKQLSLCSVKIFF